MSLLHELTRRFLDRLARLDLPRYSCPGCRTRLQPVEVPLPIGREVATCPWCRAVWRVSSWKMSLRVALLFPFITAEWLISPELLQLQVSLENTATATAILFGLFVLVSVFIPTERAPEIFASGTPGVRPKSRFVWSVGTLLVFMALAATALSVFFAEWRAWRLVRNTLPGIDGPAVFSPDGSRFALPGKYGGALIYGVEPGTPVTKVGGQQKPPFSAPCTHPIAFSEDGQRILVCEQVTADGRPEPSLLVFDVNDGTQVTKTKTGVKQWIEAACFPGGDSSSVVFLVRGGGVYELLVADGTVVRRCQLPDGIDLRFSPSGEHIVLRTLSRASKVEVWDTRRGEFVCEIQCGAVNSDNYLVELDDQQVTVLNADDAVASFDLISGERLADVIQTSRLDGPVAISPDGSRVMVGDVIYDARSRRELQRLPRRRFGHRVREVTFSPDGKRVVLVTELNRVELWYRVRRELRWVGIWDPRFWGVNGLLALFLMSWNRDEYRRERDWLKRLGDQSATSSSTSSAT